MIIEFAGCTGGGKTTLATAVAARLAVEGYAVHGPSRASPALPATAVRTVWTAARWLGRARRTESASVVQCVARATDGRTSPVWRLSRRIAAARLALEHERYGRLAGTTLVDEGILGVLHLAFGGGPAPSTNQVQALVATLPITDLVVLVDAPDDALVRRTVSRPDALRELRGRPDLKVRAWISGVASAYRIVATLPKLRARLVRVWNPSEGESELERLTDGIVRDLRRRGLL